MIKANIREGKNGSITLSIKGHAGAAKEGQDIVCASASILAYTLGQYVSECFERGYLEQEPIILLEKGRGRVTSVPKKEYYDYIKRGYAFADMGLDLLSHNYPQYVQKQFGKAKCL